jgi:hypothetical protein
VGAAAVRATDQQKGVDGRSLIRAFLRITLGVKLGVDDYVTQPFTEEVEGTH